MHRGGGEGAGEVQAGGEPPARLGSQVHQLPEAPNKPARPLPDDENVVRGAILNFTVGLDSVLQRVQQQDSVLKELARDRMQTVISKFSARLCGSERDEGKECFGVRRQLEQAPAMAEAAKAALVAVGGRWTVHDLAACLDKNFENRNASQHHNTNEQLNKDMQRLRKAGFADLLDEEMPLECLVIRHYEVFMQLLQ